MMNITVTQKSPEDVKVKLLGVLKRLYVREPNLDVIRLARL